MARKIFVLGTGVLPDPFKQPAESIATIKFISQLPGIVAIHTEPKYALLCFDSLDAAVTSHNMLTEYAELSGSVMYEIRSGELSDDLQELTVFGVVKDFRK